MSLKVVVKLKCGEAEEAMKKCPYLEEKYWGRGGSKLLSKPKTFRVSKKDCIRLGCNPEKCPLKPQEEDFLPESQAQAHQNQKHL